MKSVSLHRMLKLLLSRKMQRVLLSRKIRRLLLSRKMQRVPLSRKIQRLMLSREMRRVLLSREMRRLLLSRKMQKLLVSRKMLLMLAKLRHQRLKVIRNTNTVSGLKRQMLTMYPRCVACDCRLISHSISSIVFSEVSSEIPYICVEYYITLQIF